MEFLLTHPKVLFLINEPKEKIQRMFSYNFGYIGPPIGLSQALSLVFPLFQLEVLMLLILLQAIMVFILKDTFNLFSLVLTASLSVISLLIYNADALEVERHCYLNQPFIQLWSFLLIFILIDNLFRIFKRDKYVI